MRKGLFFSGAGEPIVLVALDWLGIDGESQDDFRKALAEAAGTIPQRVAVHTLHQHDAPRSSFAAERILLNAGLKPGSFESSYQLEAIDRLRNAVKNSLKNASPVAHLGTGSV